MDESSRLLLMYVVFPLWVMAGFADWLCHRQTRIEQTSGLHENMFHWLLLGQVGAAMLAVSLLEVNAAILLLVFAAFLGHELTTYLELHYTVPLRPVGPAEQMVHSFMEILPLVALVLLTSMHWDQAMSLLDESMPDFDLRPKEDPWPRGYLQWALVASLVFNVLPLAEETFRCWRHRRIRSRTPAPPAPT